MKNITTFGLICFIILAILLLINYTHIEQTDEFNENLFYPCLITLILGVVNIKIDIKSN